MLVSQCPKDIQFYLNKYIEFHCRFIFCINVRQQYHIGGLVRNIVSTMAAQAVS